jgi:hypothetical protein
MMINDNHASNPSVANILHEAVKDFAPIGFVGTPLILVANPSVWRRTSRRWSRSRQFRRHQPRVVGVGSASHLAGEMLPGAGAGLRPVSWRRAGNERPDRRCNTQFLSP